MDSGTDEARGREFEVAQAVAELVDTLKPEERKQVMALLAARYGIRIYDPSTGGKPPSSGYRKQPRR